MSSKDEKPTGPCEFPWTFGEPCAKPGRRYEPEGACGHVACGATTGQLFLGSPPAFAFYACDAHSVAGTSPASGAGAILCTDHAPR